jgi:D-amino-acid dehydrogenase
LAKSIVIIGAGVIGLSTAYYCMRRGHRVIVIDQSSPKDEGCSYRNAGMVVPSHFVPLAAPGMVSLGLKWMWNPSSPFYIRPRLNWDLVSWGWKFYRASTAAHVARSAPLLRDLSFASRTCFEELADLTGNEFGLVKKGLLMLCQTEKALEEEAQASEKAKGLGIPAEVLDRRQTAALEPRVRMDVAGSVHYPKDCHLSPAKFLATLRKLLEEAGVAFYWNARIERWRLGCGRIEAAMTSEQAEMNGDEFVLCGGSWSPFLTREIGPRLPMQAGKGYSLTLNQPRQLPEICSILTEARVAVTPMSGALRVGGTMEIAGWNEEVNPVRVQGIINAFCRYYSEFRPEDFRDLPVWYGLRPCSPDGLPYLGRTKRSANLTVATGHAMMGLSLGPITGKLVSEIVSGERPTVSLDLLSPDRYSR